MVSSIATLSQRTYSSMEEHAKSLISVSLEKYVHAHLLLIMSRQGGTGRLRYSYALLLIIAPLICSLLELLWLNSIYSALYSLVRMKQISSIKYVRFLARLVRRSGLRATDWPMRLASHSLTSSQPPSLKSSPTQAQTLLTLCSKCCNSILRKDPLRSNVSHILTSTACRYPSTKPRRAHMEMQQGRLNLRALGLWAQGQLASPMMAVLWGVPLRIISNRTITQVGGPLG